MSDPTNFPGFDQLSPDNQKWIKHRDMPIKGIHFFRLDRVKGDAPKTGKAPPLVKSKPPCDRPFTGARLHFSLSPPRSQETTSRQTKPRPAWPIDERQSGWLNPNSPSSSALVNRLREYDPEDSARIDRELCLSSQGWTSLFPPVGPRINIHPNHDLVVLQKQQQVAVENLIDHRSPAGYPVISIDFPELAECTKIGIELSNVETQTLRPSNWSKLSIHFPMLETVYLIDYGVTLKPGRRPDYSSAEVFEGGQHNFIEVQFALDAESCRARWNPWCFPDLDPVKVGGRTKGGPGGEVLVTPDLSRSSLYVQYARMFRHFREMPEWNRASSGVSSKLERHRSRKWGIENKTRKIQLKVLARVEKGR